MTVVITPFYTFVVQSSAPLDSSLSLSISSQCLNLLRMYLLTSEVVLADEKDNAAAQHGS